MKTEKTSGGYEILDSGSMITLDGEAGLELQIELDVSFQFSLQFQFISDGSGQIDLRSDTTDEKITLICVNFNNPIGAGTSQALELATFKGKKVWIHFWVYALGETPLRKLVYTIYYGESSILQHNGAPKENRWVSASNDTAQKANGWAADAGGGTQAADRLKKRRLLLLGLIPLGFGALVRWIILLFPGYGFPYFELGVSFLFLWAMLGFVTWSCGESAKNSLFLTNAAALLALASNFFQEIILGHFFKNPLGIWSQIFYLPIVKVASLFTLGLNRRLWDIYFVGFCLMCLSYLTGFGLRMGYEFVRTKKWM